MAVFVTGDTHGDFTRFSKKVYPQLHDLTKDDYVLICGDFGGVWDDSPEQKYWLSWLNAKPFTTLFITGNHENFDMLDAMPVSEWHGGKVHFVRPSILHLMRGQIFNIEGKRFFTMGGASSHDIADGVLDPADPDFRCKRRQLDKQNAFYRVLHESWWPRELPNETEYETARQTLDAANWKVDFVITHCCPTWVQSKISLDMYVPDKLTDFFDELWNKCDFQLWLFGHYHDNLVLGEKLVLLYEKIIRLL